MNIKATKAAIEVMQAYVDGAEIEVKIPDLADDDGYYERSPDRSKKQGWALVSDDGDGPQWQWYRAEYRIKPKAREFILELNTDGTVRNALERGEEPWFDGAVHIKVREVLE